MSDINWQAYYQPGLGEAYVYKTPDVGAIYAKQMQDYAEQRRKENEAIASELGKINTDGVRPADSDEVRRRYRALQETNYKILNSRNRDERIALRGQMQNQKMDLNQLVNDSKAAKEEAKQLFGATLTDKDGEINSDWKQHLINLNNTPLVDQKFTATRNQLQTTDMWDRKLDLPKFEEEIVKSSLKKINENTTVGSGQDLRRATRKGEELVRDNIKKNLEGLLGDAKQGKQVAKFIYNTYGNKGDGVVDPQDVEKFVEDMWNRNKDRFTTGFSVGSLVHTKPWSWSNDGGDDSGVAGIKRMVIPYGEDGKASVETDDYLPMTFSNLNFAGSPAIDMKTGRNIARLDSSNDYQIVGVLPAPIIDGDFVDSKGNRLNGAIAQPNFVKGQGSQYVKRKPFIHVQQEQNVGGVRVKRDFLIPYDRFPQNKKSTKAVKAALAEWEKRNPEQASAKSTQATQKKSTQASRMPSKTTPKKTTKKSTNLPTNFWN